MEPLLSPAQVDSRNFGSNYFMVVSPDRERHVRFPEIRHTYLHFVLDPMALSHGNTLKTTGTNTGRCAQGADGAGIQE